MFSKHDARWGGGGLVCAAVSGALAAAACSPAAPPPPPPPVVATAKAAAPPVAPSSPSSVVATAAPDPCAAIARAHAGSLASTSLGTLAPPRRDPLIPASFGTCTKTPRGLWAVAIVEAREDPPATVGCWAIVHVDESGREARAFPPPLGASEAWDTATCKATFAAANLVYGNWSSTIFSAPVFADLDGDGEPEVFVGRQGKHKGVDIASADFVWTFRDGAVAPFPRPSGVSVVELRDVDGDGRLDIVTHDPYRTDGGPQCGLQSMDIFHVVGPELLTHVRADGSVSRDDAEAKKFARKQCPERPRRIGGGARDTGHDIGCALLWGASEREITRGLASCAPSPQEKREGWCPEWCEQAKRFVKAFAALPAPLRLDQ